MVDFIHFLNHIKLLSIGGPLLTSFAALAGTLPCSLRSLRSRFALMLCAHALRSLCSHYCAPFGCAIELTSFRAESSLRSLYNKRSLRSHLLYSLVPLISIATSSLHLALLVTTLRRVPPV